MVKKKKAEAKRGFVQRSLDGVEKVGNALPNPATLFIILAGITILLSGLLSYFGVSVTYNTLTSDGGVVENRVAVFNLMSRDGIQYMVTNVIKHFTSFFALGTVFTIIIGVSVAEKTGLMESLMRKIAHLIPRWSVSAMVVFLGIMSNMASSVGYVVLVPLGAIIFMAFKRHPIAGIAAAFAGVSGGWSANLLIGANDPLFAGIATSAAQQLDASYVVSPLANWYFMIVSTFLITAIGAFITDKIVEPRLSPYTIHEDITVSDIADNEKRGLLFAGITALVYLVVMVAIALPKNSVLRGANGSLIGSSPLMGGIIFFMMLLFLLPGIAYGIGAKTVKNDDQLIQYMNEGISGISSFMVLIFFAAQFTGLFTKSNLGIIISVSGAELLQKAGFIGLPLLIAFILLTAFINIFIAIDSAKWAIMAPIFVPMFMQVGISPELTQIAYRIGDSSTNIIAPLMPFFVLVVAFFQKYDKKSGMGTVISTMIPYSMALLIGWTILMIVWYLLGLPLGPGSPLFY